MMFIPRKWKLQGVVTKTDRNSKQLVAVLKRGDKIIITTLSKFGFIGEMAKLDRRFAIIVDEAHSSQTVENVKDLKNCTTSFASTPKLTPWQEAQFSPSGNSENKNRHPNRRDLVDAPGSSLPTSLNLQVPMQLSHPLPRGDRGRPWLHKKQCQSPG